MTFNIFFGIWGKRYIMEELPQSLLFLAMIPALILMFYSLRGYDGKYKEKTFFIMIIFGIITGVLSVVIEAFTSSIGIIFIIFLFPVLEQFLKAVILNLKRFQKKQDTVIYGLSLGLGFGSVYIVSSLVSFQSYGLKDTNMFIIVFLSSLGLILAHGGTGICIGYGVYKKSLKKYLLISIALFFPFTFIGVIAGITNNFFILLAYIPYGFIIYWYFSTKIMPRILETKKENKAK